MAENPMRFAIQDARKMTTTIGLGAPNSFLYTIASYTGEREREE